MSYLIIKGRKNNLSDLHINEKLILIVLVYLTFLVVGSFIFYLEIKSIGHYQTHLLLYIDMSKAQNTLNSTFKSFKNIS